MMEATKVATESFQCWRAQGSLHQGALRHQMRMNRVHFKVELRQYKMDKTRKEADSLAKQLLRKTYNKFWKEVEYNLGNNNIGTTTDSKKKEVVDCHTPGNHGRGYTMCRVLHDHKQYLP